VQDSLSVIFTGIATGWVDVEVRLADAAPPAVDLDGWEEVVETSLTSASGQVRLRALMADTPPLPVLTHDGPGTYRLRIHVRGRDTATDLSTSEIVENYLLTIWPGPEEPDRIHKQTDTYGAQLRRSAAIQGLTVSTPPPPSTPAMPLPPGRKSLPPPADDPVRQAIIRAYRTATKNDRGEEPSS
jgi:hypothetical protein